MKRLGVRRYIQIEGRLFDRDVLESNGEPRPRGPEIMISAYSKNPVLSPVDGRVLDSRKALRNHNAALGVEDIGNDGAGRRMGPPVAERGFGSERKHMREVAESIRKAEAEATSNGVPEHLRRGAVSGPDADTRIYADG